MYSQDIDWTTMIMIKNLTVIVDEIIEIKMVLYAPDTLYLPIGVYA